MKRSSIIILALFGLFAPAIIGLIAGSIVIFGFLRLSENPPQIVERLGVVTQVATSATLERAGSLNDLTEDFDVQTGDRIRVPEDGSVALIWNGYGRTILAGGTDVTLEELSGFDRLRVRLRLHAGRIWTRLQRLLDLGSDFTVRSSDVVATVRGTSFGLERKTGGVETKVKESKVEVAKFPLNAVLTDLDPLMKNAASVEAGSFISTEDSSRELPRPQIMTEVQLADPFMLEGDRVMDASEYTLIRGLREWLPWIMWGISYANEHPEVLESEEAFREFLGMFPESLRRTFGAE